MRLEIFRTSSSGQHVRLPSDIIMIHDFAHCAEESMCVCMGFKSRAWWCDEAKDHRFKRELELGLIIVITTRYVVITMRTEPHFARTLPRCFQGFHWRLLRTE